MSDPCSARDESVPLMTAAELDECLSRLAADLAARHGSCENIALIGIQRRGALIAERLHSLMLSAPGRDIPVGSLDITLYRDDWTAGAIKPVIRKTDIPFDVEGKNLILVDDVLFTGRTVRAAMEALADFGRPGRVELLALVDRGHRELPIHPDYVGVRLATDKNDRVDVLLSPLDGEDGVRLVLGR
ncbi:MAG: bifunctional pyr operon transcriptional regulator/uracil phosphoribosyltransferase PyrR [Desulfovibrio sp.]|jgi:pyrimidine operon attenuation protein/uracil phosphoribosyltransferase|nr:bifunctional pyr operon transcriptional regulator/uracil phosphoribosyltransferase PyrR [Desulfovibrio sp.]